MKYTFVLLSCLVLAWTAQGVLAHESIQESSMPSEPFELYRSALPNGLRVWIQPRPGSESVTTLLVVGAGSRYEDASNNGASHYVEHMLFTGTERWSEEEIKDVIARRGGRWNGWTGFEQTTYFAHVAAPDLDIALDWLAELVFHPTFPEDKVDKERQVIFQERWGRYGWLINALDSWGFGYELDRDVRRVLFPGSTIGLRIVGEDASLEGLDRAALMDYYRRHYTLENAVLIVVGGVSQGQILDRAAHYFGALDRTGRVSGLEMPPLPAGGPYQVVVRGPMPTAQVSMMMGARTVGRAHPDRWALEVLARMLGKDLREEIRYQRGLVYGLGAYNVYLDDAGYFVVSTTSDRQSKEEILQTIEQHLDRVRRGEIDADAVEEAKAALKGSWALAMEDNVERAKWLAQWPSLLSEEEVVPDYPAQIDAVTPEDLSRVVAVYFVPERSYAGRHEPVVTVASGARAVGAVVVVGMGLWGVRRLRRRIRGRG